MLIRGRIFLLGGNKKKKDSTRHKRVLVHHQLGHRLAAEGGRPGLCSGWVDAGGQDLVGFCWRSKPARLGFWWVQGPGLWGNAAHRAV